VEDLCLHKMAAGLYERLQKVRELVMCNAQCTVSKQNAASLRLVGCKSRHTHLQGDQRRGGIL